MRFETKYGIGDYVHLIHRVNVSLPPEPCSACEGTGKCVLKGQSYRCPKCDGKAVTQEQGRGWVISDAGEIRHIEIRTRTPDDSPDDREEWDQRPEEVRYMFARSRSGGVYEEHSLWPSREAALAECERRNS